MAARFLRPTWIKLAFLVEWFLFILITWMQGGLETRRQALIAAYPLLFFYAIAGLLEVISHKIQRLARGWWMLLLAIGLTVIDQIIKLLVTTFIPFRTAKPLIPGWLNLAHNCNFQGSWVFSQLDVPTANLIPLGFLAFLMLFGSWFSYRYYITHQRASLWADVAFLGLFAGLASWLLEMIIRGHIVDFLCLPEVVTADLKDIYLTIGVAAIFVETIDNPGLSRSWQGWRQESANLRWLVKKIVAFSRQELSASWLLLMRRQKNNEE